MLDDQIQPTCSTMVGQLQTIAHNTRSSRENRIKFACPADVPIDAGYRSEYDVAQRQR